MVKQNIETTQDNLWSAVQNYFMHCTLPPNMLADSIMRLKTLQSTSSAGRQGYGDKRNKITVTLHPPIIDQLLRNNGLRHGTDEAISYGIELTVERKRGKSPSESAPKERPNRHADVCGTSSVGAVYRILMKCGKMYVGQTGRDIKRRLTEHQRILRKTEKYKSSTLRDHSKTCQACLSDCRPLIERTTVFYRHTDKLTREVIEAFEMAIIGKQCCFSRPSVALSITLFEPAEKKTTTTNNYLNSEAVIDAQDDATEEVYAETFSFRESVPDGADNAIKVGGKRVSLASEFMEPQNKWLKMACKHEKY